MHFIAVVMSDDTRSMYEADHPFMTHAPGSLPDALVKSEVLTWG